METIRSFKGYGKVDELEQQAFRRKTRKRVIILIISSIALVAVIIGAVIGVVVHKNKNDSSSDNMPATQLTPAASLKAVCSVTRYPDSCFSSISSIDASNVTKDPEILFKLSLQVAMNELEKLQNYPSKLKQQTKDPQVIEALKVCETLFDDALDHVNESLSSMKVGSGEKLLSSKKIQDLKTWLSTSITDQDTCLDALQELNVSHYENSNILKDIRSAMQNSTEFASNSLAIAVAGRGFIAKDMTFINTAGPEKHQAVAFRSGSDRSVFYRCSFNAYQDTLYAHSNRQFYRDCDITGTIDFIFGNAAVVFQNCNILPRQPLPNQFNTITAQGKKDPNQNTGISIQKCTLSRFDDKLTAATYLGRPWKEFSTTVIMQSTIGPFLNALGWKEWVSGVDPPTSIFYAEYQNVGLGSTTSGRVKWAGYRPTLTTDEAAKFTVGNFIQGSEWLAEANVQYQESL
ncbi:hypothetical protein CUMW_201100 [Citrus unshiu]|uniref:Pectinesterase n=1 Tax=Citrus unshiu TaxID=55188 RepID=A0A2H5Q6W3_CITUN|nr:hypothetical protein CUMW_201100 [Citrus unshiu]